MGKWDHSGTLLLSALFYQSTPSCLKVRGGKWECAGSHVELLLVPDLAVHLEGGHVVVAHVIIVSS